MVFSVTYFFPIGYFSFVVSVRCGVLQAQSASVSAAGGSILFVLLFFFVVVCMAIMAL